MQTAKIFKNGNSQAVRLPKEFQFDDKEVEIMQRGDEIVLRKKQKTLKDVFDLLCAMPDDFFAEQRQDPKPEERESF
ncbi:MAG: virulence factor [Deltaproteobacteria bacterium RIFOXYD12_FULL_50_9]|nr:MAG: virulence factor [Deltaproteobacteria bacterium RIFOXYD12_FULL_50_9]